MRFDECLAWLISPQIEGGYSDRRADRGGATNKGITQHTYDIYRQSLHLPLQPVKFLTLEETSDIYRTSYWNPVKAGKLPTPLDLCLFDASVQHGTGRASKWLQRVVGTTPDGSIGNATLTALAALISRNGLKSVVDEYMKIREDFYAEIIANDPSQVVFKNGWANRMGFLKIAIKEFV